MRTSEIVRRVWATLEPELAEQGFELVEVEVDQQGSRRILRLYIDREGGVTLDDCAAASQFVGPLLDAKALVDGTYVLEMSSPGIDRPVRKASDFRRFTGERLRVSTYEPVAGRKRLKGTLTGLEDGLVHLDCDGQAYAIHVENVKKARLDR